MRFVSWFKPFAILALILALAACESDEERAERHYQSGLALLEEGDVDRALIEFRNVFKNDGFHREARTLYARLVREQGKFQESYSQYLLLVEQYPEDYEGRLALSEMAFVSGNLEEYRRHGGALADLASPDDTAAKAIALGLQYQEAVLAEDASARRAVVRDAQSLAEAEENNPVLSRVLIDGHLRDQEFSSALAEVDKLLSRSEIPDKTFESLKLQILGQMGDEAAVETQLRAMVDLFPEDEALPVTLMRYYMAQGKTEEAEAFLRDTSDPTAEDVAPYATYISFLSQTRGIDAALEELNRGIEAAPGQMRLKALRAGFDYEQGRVDKAIADLTTLLEGSEPGDDTNTVRVALAQIMLSTGDEVGARQMVEQVLEADPSQGIALRMQAAWMIEADDTIGAIAALRTALDQDPEDVAAMTLMSQAHTRAGNHELAQDFLSLAAEASGFAPAESLRFATVLTQNERYRAAEDTLIASLRVNPSNPEILLQLGRVYLLSGDQSRAEQVIATLRRLDTDRARRVANDLEAAQLSATTTDLSNTIRFLENVAQSGEGSEAAAARVNIIRARLISGDVEGALAYANEQLAENPDDASLRLALSSVLLANRDFENAEKEFARLVAENPEVSALRLQLIRSLRAQGKGEESAKVLEEGLALNPEAPDLLWAQASDLQRDGDIDGAIAIYDAMYERSSNLAIIANNLASLLSTYRDDEESLEKARTIALRFRGTDVPAFQDTYGWIAYRSGNLDEALEYLEPAAEGLPNDPLTQYHLGKTYVALERPDDALAAFRRVLELTSEVDTRPQIEEARAEVVRLSGG